MELIEEFGASLEAYLSGKDRQKQLEEEELRRREDTLRLSGILDLLQEAKSVLRRHQFAAKVEGRDGRRRLMWNTESGGLGNGLGRVSGCKYNCVEIGGLPNGDIVVNTRVCRFDDTGSEQVITHSQYQGDSRILEQSLQNAILNPGSDGDYYLPSR